MIPRTFFSLVMLSLLLALASDGKTFGQSPQQSSPAIAKLVLAQHVETLGPPAREPMIIEHPSGVQFVTGHMTPGRPQLWKSLDHGATWTRVDVGSEAQGAIGNSDCDLAVAADGTIYFVSLIYNGKEQGIGIAVGVSRDIGATWSWASISKVRFDDRPWVAVAPDGTAHIIWNNGSGVSHSVSRDRGVTWTTGLRIHYKGGSSHLAVGPNGEVAARIIPLSVAGSTYHHGVDLIAVSTDGGATWQKHPAPGQRDWHLEINQPGRIPRWVEPIAWDVQGSLYSLWTNRTGVWLARSADRGVTWRQWRVSETTDLAHFSYLIARGKGELAATWFTGSRETLQWHAARIDVGDGEAPPRVMESAALRTDSWEPPDRPGNPAVRDTAGEYLGITFLRDGGFAVVSPIQDVLNWRFGFSWWRFEAH